MPDAAIVALANEHRAETTASETLAQVQARLAALNEVLASAGNPVRIWADAPSVLVPAPKNARFMKQDQFARLVANVRADGGLESMPLCWREPRGAGHRDWILSGHHRVEAAKAAGLPWVLYLFTDRVLTEGQRIAKQLSHNAIAGEDNQAVLKELYDAIADFEQKQYSGVDEVAVGHLADPVASSFQDAQLEFEEVSLLFLPHEHERFREAVELLTARSDMPVYLASMAAWRGFYEQLLRYKENANIVNTTTAILKLTEYARTESDRLEREREEQEAASGT